MSWLTQYFLNPSFVLPGAALAALPIVIHLLSRLRYKRVRFAAMEFLLQSDELNRRRLILEQLLLLLLRVLAVVLIVLLLARLVLDPSRMLILRGATTHHVLILDDTLSMRQSARQGTVFDRAVATLKNILSQDSGRSGSLRVSVLTVTSPDRPLVTDRALNGALIQEVLPRLRNLSCSWQAKSPEGALLAAENLLAGDGGVASHVHVISDLRKSDWLDRPQVTQALRLLGEIDTTTSLIHLTGEVSENIVLTQLEADTLGVAVGIPWRMHLTVKNHCDRLSSGLRATVYVDGNALPARVLLPDIEARESVTLDHDIVFDASGIHAVEVRLEDDALTEDNSRFVVVDVAESREVLIVDDEGGQADAGFVSDALSPDPRFSGVSTTVRTSDALAALELDDFDCIYLLNIRELPADITDQLMVYVEGGGGVAWFPDSQANTTWYNTALRGGDQPLFPVPLGTVQQVVAGPAASDGMFEQPVFESHPVFAMYADPELPLAETIRVSQWFGVASDWDSSAAMGAGVRILARLKNGDPVVFEHGIGGGRILTFLTTAGRRWTNWPVMPAGPGYVVMNMLIHQYLQKPSEAVELREVGDSLRFSWSVDEFAQSVQVTLPASATDSGGENRLRLTAAPVVSAADDRENTDGAATDDGASRLSVDVTQADRPGIYRLKRFRLDGQPDDTWLALSVSPLESDLTPVRPGELEGKDGLQHVRVVSADAAGDLISSDVGREMRWLLIGLLMVVLICEQLLSLRLSFHPEGNSK